MKLLYFLFFFPFEVTDEGSKIGGNKIATNGKFCMTRNYFIIPSNSVLIYK